MEKPLLAPGCFGSVLAFDEKGEICIQCQFNGSCAIRSSERRTELVSTLSLSEDTKSVLIRSARKRAPRRQTRESLPDHILQLLAKLKGKGVDLMKLARGINPLSKLKSPVTMYLIFERLIKGPCSKKDLAAELLGKVPNLSGETANAHAAQTVAIISGLDLAYELDDLIFIKK